MSNKASTKNINLSSSFDGATNTKLLAAEIKLAKLLSVPGIDASERMVLEPRILLDAAGVETADTVIDQIALEQAENWQTPIIEDDITSAVRALPHDTWFKVELLITDPLEEVSIKEIIRRVAVIDANPQSFASRIFNQIAYVLIRESGF